MRQPNAADDFRYADSRWQRNVTIRGRFTRPEKTPQVVFDAHDAATTPVDPQVGGMMAVSVP
jgi:hypothetical protein